MLSSELPTCRACCTNFSPVASPFSFLIYWFISCYYVFPLLKKCLTLWNKNVFYSMIITVLSTSATYGSFNCDKLFPITVGGPGHLLHRRCHLPYTAGSTSQLFDVFLRDNFLISAHLCACFICVFPDDRVCFTSSSRASLYATAYFLIDLNVPISWYYDSIIHRRSRG